MRIILFAWLFLLLSCSNPKDKFADLDSSELKQTNLYNNKIAPEAFLLLLKKDPYLFEFAVLPDSIPKNWVQKSDVIALSKYLDDTTKCTKVINSYFSNSLASEYVSDIQQEALKIINFYFTKNYPYSAPFDLSKSEVQEWIRANE